MDGVGSRESQSEVDTPADAGPQPDPPRFEFRVWGEPVADAARRLRSRSAPLETRTSTETYFVSTATVDVNVKARVDLLDIKTLVAVQKGCEQWALHLKAPFPVPAPVISSELFEALGVAPPPMNRGAYDLDALIGDLVAPHPDVAAVAVTKHREIHSAGGCLAEVTEVSFAGQTHETLAVESVDLEAVTDLREALGLRGSVNRSYPATIRTALGGRFAMENG